VRLQGRSDRFRRPEMAFHEQQLFGHGDELHDGKAQIRLLDQYPAAGFQHADQLRNRCLLVGEMMEGIDDHDAGERPIGEGELLRPALNTVEPPLLAGLPEHASGEVGDDDTVHVRPEKKGSPPRASSGVQKPAPRGQSQQFFQIVGVRRPQEAIVGEGDEVEVPVSQILQQGVLLFFPLQWLR